MVVALVPLAVLTGCAGLGQPAPYDQPGINGLVIPTPKPDPGDFVDGVDNPWLALESGARWTYDVRGGGDGAPVGVVVDVLADPVPVAGVEATAVTTTTDLGGGKTTVVTRLYAQDDDGNVWLVGADGGPGLEGDGWRAGVDGAEAGLAMPARPRIGDGWLSYAVPGLPQASAEVADLSTSTTQLRESGAAGSSTLRTYEKGIGLTGVEDLDAGWRAVLVDRPGA